MGRFVPWTNHMYSVVASADGWLNSLPATPTPDDISSAYSKIVELFNYSEAIQHTLVFEGILPETDPVFDASVTGETVHADVLKAAIDLREAWTALFVDIRGKAIDWLELKDEADQLKNIEKEFPAAEWQLAPAAS